MNPGKIFENEFEELLVKGNFSYIREGSKRTYGRQFGNKGKYDFKLTWAAVELKTINRASDLRMPFPKIKSPIIKGHQIKALRQAHKNGLMSGFLILYREKQKLFYIDIIEFHRVVIKYGMIRTLKIAHCEEFGIELKDLSEYIEMYKKLKRKKEKQND